MALVLLLAKCSFALACEPPASDASIAVPGHPFAAVASPDDCWLFVSLTTGREKGALGVLRNTGGQFVVDHVDPLPGPGYGESISPDGDLLVVTEGDTVDVFDTGKLERREASPLVTTLKEGRDAGATYAVMSHDGRLLFVSDEYARRVSVFDVAKVRQGDGSSLVGRIPAGLAPVGLATSPDGQWLYVTSQVGPKTAGGKTCKPETENQKFHPEGLLLRISIAAVASDPAHAINGVLPVGCNPVRVAVSPSGKDLWISARGDNALLRLQPDGWTGDNAHLKLKVYPVGPSPIGVAVRGDDAQAWVAVSDRFEKQGRGVLVGLTYHAGDANDADPRLMKTGAIEYPREVAFLHDNRSLVVTLFDANRVAVIRTPD